MQTNLIQLATLFSLVIANLASGASPARDYPLTPVSLDKVEIDDGFWRQRLDTHFESTLDHVLDQCRETGRLHNFEVAAGRKEGEFQGRFFNESHISQRNLRQHRPGALESSHVPALPGYLYATEKDTVYACLYAASTAEVNLGNTTVKIEQQTEYPWDGANPLSPLSDLLSDALKDATQKANS
jgi:DUF1680 family protein